MLVEVGEFCAVFQDHALRNLPCKKIQADELWAFVGAKARNAKTPGYGDIWTFVAMCADTKLNVSWLVGNPKEEDVSTSYVERDNISVRMHSRRFTRLTNGFSKKVTNHACAVALHFFVANFCRSHMTLTKAAGGIHTSPAMAAKLTDHVWTIEDMLGMMDGSLLIGS